MQTKAKNIVTVIVMAVFLFALTFFCWFKPADDFSNSERRSLSQFPEFSAETVLNKDPSKTFMKLFESYSLDQFPMRDTFRGIKTFAAFNIFNRSDNNDLYLHNGYLAQLEYPIKEDSIDYASGKFQAIYDKFIKDTDAKVYFAIVPDKGHYLSQETGHLSIDFKEFYDTMAAKLPFAAHIDMTPSLSIESYYKTDTHWRQENIIPAAQLIAGGMNTPIKGEYTVNTVEHPFYGVYHGQSALPLPAEEIKYLTADWMESATVYDHATNKPISFYDMSKATGKDPYEMYLSGNLSVITIENPNSATDKELILFRDSFGSSMAPLLAEGYAKVTVIDIRQIHSGMLGTLKDSRTGEPMIDFANADDVLFMYSSIILNSSSTLK